jgi:transposase-like protein
MKSDGSRRLETAGTTDEAATNQQLLCDGGQVRVCPECGSRNLRPKTTTENGGRREYEEDWFCQTCSSHVDAKLVPESEAPARRSGDVGPSEDAKMLLEADPDDVGRPMTDGGQEIITACPHCDSARIVRRVKTSLRQRWRCKDCEERFDEATRRPSRGTNVSTTGLARKLEQADPDDLDDGELVTDGGREEGGED